MWHQTLHGPCRGWILPLTLKNASPILRDAQSPLSFETLLPCPRPCHAADMYSESKAWADGVLRLQLGKGGNAGASAATTKVDASQDAFSKAQMPTKLRKCLRLGRLGFGLLGGRARPGELYCGPRCTTQPPTKCKLIQGRSIVNR